MTQRPRSSQQLVTVNQSDVDKMLDSYDSGMFDVSTSNAIAQALKRMLKEGQRVHVNRHSSSLECCVQIGDYRFELSEELFDWLERAERASPVESISFWVALPPDVLRTPRRESLAPDRSEQDVPLRA
jgi:hypothetical protein